jgi:hypothetical protein
VTKINYKTIKSHNIYITDQQTVVPIEHNEVIISN